MNKSATFEELLRKRDSCPTCGGSGYRSSDVPCSCVTDANYELRLSKSGIPPLFQKRGLEDYVHKTTPTFAKIKLYLDHAEKAAEEGTGLVIVGPMKAGKTLLAVGLLKELMRRGYPCGFVTFAGMIGALSAAERYVGPHMTFSCIDDISRVLNSLTNFKSSVLTGEVSHGAVELLHGVLDKRAMHNLPTILTSGSTIAEIGKKFPSLGTFLTGSCMEVVCVSDDFRRTHEQARINKEFGFDEVDNGR